MCGRKTEGWAFREKTERERQKKMTTIREMVSEVLDNQERFPKGWGTTVKDYFKAKGKDHLEVKQTKVWMLTIRKAYEGVAAMGSP